MASSIPGWCMPFNLQGASPFFLGGAPGGLEIHEIHEIHQPTNLLPVIRYIFLGGTKGGVGKVPLFGGSFPRKNSWQPSQPLRVDPRWLQGLTSVVSGFLLGHEF